MGCRQSRSSFDKKSTENEKLEKFEDSLSLKKNECSVYEGIISRLAGSSLSPAQALESFQEFSKISFSPDLVEVILEAFRIDDKIDLKAFRCLCIVLSKSSEMDKGEALWYTFDSNLQDQLPKKSIKDMIGYLIKCSVGLGLAVAIRTGYYDRQKMLDWEAYLKDRVTSLEIKLVKHFTQGKETITKEEFMLRLQDRPEGYITSTSAIRTQLEHTQVIPNRFASPFKNMKVTKLTSK
jgi:hypothetical protein